MLGDAGRREGLVTSNNAHASVEDLELAAERLHLNHDHLSGQDSVGSMRVVVARSEEEVDRLRDVWNSWRVHPNANIDFYLQVLHSNREIVRPHIVVLYRNNVPVAMLVGRVLNSKIETRLGYARLFRTSARTLAFIHGGLAGDLSDANSEILVGSVIESLSQGEADLAEFRFLRTDSTLYQALSRVPGRLMRDHFPSLQAHWSLKLPTNPSAIYSKMSSKARKNLKWQAKKLKEHFADSLRICLFSRKEQLEEMFVEIESVAKKTYHRALGFGFSDTPDMRQRMLLEAEKGWLRAYVLYLARKPSAFWVGSACDGTFHSSFLGYDDEHARFSPGIFLITQVLEQFCSEGLEEVDFGLGDAEYKQRFGNCHWEDACVHIFALSPRGLGINALRTPGIVTDDILKRLLRKMEIHDFLKKFWRNRAKSASV
jgi:Acetyltransferase (GNAT) domain